MKSLFIGKEIEIPKVIQDMLVEDEQVLHAVQQARSKQLITPDRIFITNKRIIVNKLRMLGLRKNIEDYRFVDVANTNIDHGIIRSDIRLKMRFQENDVFLEAIPKKVSREIFKTIQQGVAGRLEGSEFETPANVIYPRTKKAKESNEDHLSIIQKRYAKGEISKRSIVDLEMTYLD